MGVPGGPTSGRLPEASNADHTLPDLALLSQMTGGSTPPTSLALTQPTPGWRVSPSPPYRTNNQSGRLSICLSVLHWGKRVKTTESSFGPEWKVVAESILSHISLCAD